MVIAGLMSGMKAGLYYPSWPDMNGEFLPAVLKISENWSWNNMINYDSYLFAPALIQFTHRLVAYILFILTIVLFVKLRKQVYGFPKKWLNTCLFLVISQVILDVLTVLNVQGKIPLILGVSHQLFGLLYFMSLLFLLYTVRTHKS